MFKNNILFVVGAGASAEFGMPVGYGLSDIIAKRSRIKPQRFGRDFEGDYTLWDCLRRKYQDGEIVHKKLTALNQIHHHIYLSSSIDNFLDKHNFDLDIVEMGKLQIAVNLAECESRSTLYFDTTKANARLDLVKNGNTWLDSFTRILIEGVGRNEISSLFDGISIICFNYDRCIEYYLLEAIRQSYVGVEYAEAFDVISKLEIIHPYGSLGKLPSHMQGGLQNEVRFGHTLDGGLHPWPIIENLKTYTERIDDFAMIKTLRAAVDRSEIVVFLGFAFHPQNMKLLKISNGSDVEFPGKIYSTGRGISLQEYDQVKIDISRLYHQSATMHSLIDIMDNGSCHDLFKVHRRNLAES